MKNLHISQSPITLCLLIKFSLQWNYVDNIFIYLTLQYVYMIFNHALNIQYVCHRYSEKSHLL